MGQQPCGQLVGHLDITAEVARRVLGGVAQQQGQPLGAPGVQARLVSLQPLSLGRSQKGGEDRGQRRTEAERSQEGRTGVQGPQEAGARIPESLSQRWAGQVSLGRGGAGGGGHEEVHLQSPSALRR